MITNDTSQNDTKEKDVLQDDRKIKGAWGITKAKFRLIKLGVLLYVPRLSNQSLGFTDIKSHKLAKTNIKKHQLIAKTGD